MATLLGGGVLGDSLGAFRHGVFCKFTRQEEADSSLDLPGSDGGALVVMGQTRGFGSDALEDVIHERVHDGHSLGGDTSVGVDLLEHLVDVDAVGFLPLALLLLVALGDGLLGLAGLFGSFSGGLGWHAGDAFTRKIGENALGPSYLCAKGTNRARDSFGGSIFHWLVLIALLPPGLYKKASSALPRHSYFFRRTPPQPCLAEEREVK